MLMLIAAVSLFAYVSGTVSKCHVCSSDVNATCAIGKKEGEERFHDNIYLTKCESDNNHICRIITQKVREVETVIRSCGHELYKKKTDTCYKTLNQYFNTRVCTCSTEGCNSASGLHLSIMAVVATVIASVMAS